MSTPNFLILYVKDLPKSVEFYKTLLDLSPANQSPGFALFVLPNGLQFGLWLAGTVDPEAESGGGGAELCIPLADAAGLDQAHETSKALGHTIIQTPREMSFGLTYVVEDPDRHRIRYYVPAA